MSFLKLELSFQLDAFDFSFRLFHRNGFLFNSEPDFYPFIFENILIGSR